MDGVKKPYNHNHIIRLLPSGRLGGYPDDDFSNENKQTTT